jgi:hypothetical protein
VNRSFITVRTCKFHENITAENTRTKPMGSGFESRWGQALGFGVSKSKYRPLSFEISESIFHHRSHLQIP